MEGGFEAPKLLTGTIYQAGAEPTQTLFTFRRMASLSGSTVRVERDYRSPAGATAALERVVYENGRLASYELEELQTGARGRAVVRPDPRKAHAERLFFDYTRAPGVKTKSGSEELQTDVLVNDMIPGFILRHWADLNRGASPHFRFIVLQRAETVGFKLTKESEGTWHGTPEVRIRMEPTSIVIAHLVEPIHFFVEKGGEHRILRYDGRTTPMIKRGNKWEDLDATTVFDWAKAPP